MKTSDIARLAALNLYRRLGRSMLTVVGVVIGTACIVIMISIGLTNLNQFETMIEGAELTKIEVISTNSGAGLSEARLDDAAVTAFSQIKNVESVIPMIRLATHMTTGKYYADYFSICAVPAEMIGKMAKLEEGRYFSVDGAMPEIIMGLGAARYFISSEDDYRKRDYSGPTLEWLSTQPELYLGSGYDAQNSDMPSSRMYRVNIVGIIKDTDENYQSQDVYISLETAKSIIQDNYKLANKLNIQANTYDSVFIFANSMEDVMGILDIVRGYGFEAYSNTQWIQDIQQQQKAQQGQLAAIGFISLLVSAIGIANTMMTGILERRGEIGVMKVIGVAISKIRILFLIESAMIGLVGGLIGIVLSHLLAYLMSTGSDATVVLGMYFGSGVKLVIPIWLDLAAIGVAMVVGVIAGIFPANRATKMSPMEAIRGN